MSKLSRCEVRYFWDRACFVLLIRNIIREYKQFLTICLLYLKCDKHINYFLYLILLTYAFLGTLNRRVAQVIVPGHWTEITCKDLPVSF